jgi:hypothetical protein
MGGKYSSQAILAVSGDKCVLQQDASGTPIGALGNLAIGSGAVLHCVAYSSKGGSCNPPIARSLPKHSKVVIGA